MSAEFEINVGEEQKSPMDEAAKELEKKQKSEELYGLLKKLMTGGMKLSPGELEMMKKKVIQEIADLQEED